MRKLTTEQASPLVILVVTVAFVSGLLAGCSSMATSPLQDLASRTSVPAGASFAGAGTSTMPVDQPTDGAATPPPSGGTPDATVVLAPLTPGGMPIGGLSFRAADVVNGGKAGVDNGRWSLVVPKDAIKGNAHVSLGVPSSKSTGCQLEITPAEANHFDVPVTLVADLHGVSPKRMASYVIQWYNPESQAWEPVAGSKVDTKKKTASAPLSHFSLYCVGPASGKSGW